MERKQIFNPNFQGFVKEIQEAVNEGWQVVFNAGYPCVLIHGYEAWVEKHDKQASEELEVIVDFTSIQEVEAPSPTPEQKPQTKKPPVKRAGAKK